MIKAEIILTFKSGQKMSYANKFLAEKTGDDGAGNLLHKGIDGYAYYYTGAGSDTYDAQTGLGKVKGDFDFFVKQINGTGLLNFPEADSAHASTTEYVRKGDITDKPFNRISINASELAAVEVKETWTTYPVSENRESGYRLPKDSVNFAGFRESDYIKKEDKGPDFDAHKRFDNGFLANPTLEIKDGKLNILNKDDYDETISKEVSNGFEAYGIKDGKKSGVSFIAK